MKYISVVLVGLTLATSASAEEIVYRCELSSHSRTGWVSPLMYIWVDEAEQRAWVVDGIVHKVYEDPIKAKYTQRSSSSFNVSWSVENVPISNNSETLDADFSATVWTSTGRVSTNVYLGGGADSPPQKGSGTCEVQTK